MLQRLSHYRLLSFVVYDWSSRAQEKSGEPVRGGRGRRHGRGEREV